MGEILSGSGFFCVVLTIGAYHVGWLCQKKWKKAIFNPILIGTILVMLALWALNIPVEQYQNDCKPLTYLTTPATICLAIAFYEQLKKLKKHFLAIFFGVLGGTLASLLSVWLIAVIFEFSENLKAT